MLLSQGNLISYTSTSFSFAIPKPGQSQTCGLSEDPMQAALCFSFTSIPAFSRSFGSLRKRLSQVRIFLLPESRSTGLKILNRKPKTGNRSRGIGINNRTPPPHNCFQLLIQARFISVWSGFSQKISPSEGKKMVYLRRRNFQHEKRKEATIYRAKYWILKQMESGF